jgi:hypothetical protein
MKMQIRFSVDPDKVSGVIAHLAKIGVTAVAVSVKTDEVPTWAVKPSDVVGYQDEQMGVSADQTRFDRLVRETLTPRKPREAQRGPDKGKRTFEGGVKDKGITGPELILQMFKTSSDPVIHRQEFEQEFVKHGFKANSCSAPLSNLIKAGTLTRVSDGRYRLTIRGVKHDQA